MFLGPLVRILQVFWQKTRFFGQIAIFEAVGHPICTFLFKKISSFNIYDVRKSTCGETSLKELKNFDF